MAVTPNVIASVDRALQKRAALLPTFMMVPFMFMLHFHGQSYRTLTADNGGMLAIQQAEGGSKDLANFIVLSVANSSYIHLGLGLLASLLFRFARIRPYVLIFYVVLLLGMLAVQFAGLAMFHQLPQDPKEMYATDVSNLFITGLAAAVVSVFAFATRRVHDRQV